jgi:hypothetical protein
MNPGILASILILITLILLASGWKPVLLGGIPVSVPVVFFIAWGVLCRWRFSPADGTVLYGVVPLLAAVAIGSVWGSRFIANIFQLVSFGLFLASVYYLLKHLGDFDPFFLPYRQAYGTAAVVGLLAAALVRKPKDQLGSISLGLLAGGFLYAYLQRDAGGVRFGGPAFQDDWWLAVVTARTLSVSAEYAIAAVRGMKRQVADRWKGMRK